MELEPDERKLKPYCKYRNYINVSRSESYKGVIVPTFMEDRSEAEAMLEEHEDFYRAAAKEILKLKLPFINLGISKNSAVPAIKRGRLKWAIPRYSPLGEFLISHPLDTSTKAHVLMMTTQKEDGTYPYELITQKDLKWYPIQYYRIKVSGEMFTLAISKKYNMLMILKGRNVLKVDDPMWEKVITKATMMFAL